MPAKPSGALIICGRGADLGHFEAYAGTLVSTDLRSRYAGASIKIKSTMDRDEFFDIVATFGRDFLLREFHIFCHS
jgi:hypothetical protein